MAVEYDLLIRGGLVVDGTGEDPFVGDVAVIGDRIVSAEIGCTAKEIIDAAGCLVTPGFVDIHTHYDGQVTWDDTLQPSSFHGVTTVIFGNCGVGFAPCKPEQRRLLIRLMEGVEDIPEVVMNEGLPWKWESFPDYLAFLDGRRWDVDVAAHVPHSAVRTFVMDERASKREPARSEDISEMRRIVMEGVAAGALGFSTSRSILHRSKDGQLAPTVTAAETELAGIVDGLRELDRGVIQMVDDFVDPVADFAMWRRIVERSGRPLSFTLGQRNWEGENWRTLLAGLEKANDDGLPITGQVLGRPLGILLGLELSANPLLPYPAYRDIEHLPLREKLARLKTPEVRDRILSDEPIHDDPDMAMIYNSFDDMFVLGDPPCYTPNSETSISQMAARAGVTPLEIAYDILIEGEGKTILYAALANFVGHSMDNTGTMLSHRNTVPGVGDGGAHYGLVCDASISTFLLTYWARDAPKGKLPMPYIVKQLTADAAATVGLNDRGRIAPGYKADLNVIDFDRLRLHAPFPVFDLPSGGRRLMQKADGYVATIVSGVITQRQGRPTGKRPGRLVRGAQEAVSRAAR